jgi:hypothetical protein
VKKSQTVDSLPAGNVSGIACNQARDRTIQVLFSAITATTCNKFPAHDGQGNRIEWQGIFCGRQGSFRTSRGFLHTLYGETIMATVSSAILCSFLALTLWVPPGLLIARRLPLEHDLRLAAAPALGWAVQNVVALYAAMLGGFTPMTVLAATVLVGTAAILLQGPASRDAPSPPLPLWIFAAAAIVAAGPAACVLPKIVPEGIALADPLYDHAKIALVDEIVRTGVPPANPFIGTADGGPGSIAYYYYWLFGAAQLALISGASGWEADAAVTWFAAFASLTLMCGLASHLSGGLEIGWRRFEQSIALKPGRPGFRAASAMFVLAAASGGSLRPVITALSGQAGIDAVLERESGLAGWFFQASWSPHHVASATAVLLALLLMERLARTPSAAAAVVLGLVAAAGFGSSLWVGGITFACCGSAAGAVLLVSAKPGRRLPFLAALVMAGCIAIALVFPLLVAQLHAATQRGDGAPVLILPYPTLNPDIPEGLRGWLDIPAYWLLLLPTEFPVVWVLGVAAALRLKSALAPALSVAAFASLCGGWLLVSTAGENNDLGWRAVIPGVLILTAFAGAWFARCLARQRFIAMTAGVALLALALPDGFSLLHLNIVGRLSADAARFRDAPALWAAVRRHTAPNERVASNPRLTSDLAPWPISLSWALLANRRSCFAGDELALAFASLPPEARARAAELFERVFAGASGDADLQSLVLDFDCETIVLTPQDGAWGRDPFAANALFARVEEADGRWRIYRASR